MKKPFVIKKYNQTKLVKANDYQHADTMHLLNFWLEINTRIQSIIKNQTSETLSYRIKLVDGEISDLKFLIEDYINHLEHHLDQIFKD